MKVKLKNSTGGSISVDIEMNDTPKEIIAKARSLSQDYADMIRKR